MIGWTSPSRRSLWDDKAPVRGELFGLERLEQHARALAASQDVSRQRSRGHPLADRLRDNATFLLTATRTIADTAGARRQVTPAAEWLIDNYHLVDMQVREIGIDLPPGYYSQLPKLAAGPFIGLPRVFALTWSLVAHTDSLFEPETLCRYLLAYQENQPLTIGELWAVPITLRIVLIENLRRFAESIVVNSAARQEADRLADRLLANPLLPDSLPTDDAGGRAERSAQVVASVQPGAISDAFAVQLAHRLRGRDPREEPAQGWLERRLADQDTTIDAVVRNEQQRQGASTATIRNIINSLRTIGGSDWTEAFERVCLVHRTLAEDRAFLDMDFPTRNLYRTEIETLARGSDHAELDIARRAIAAAKQAKAAPGDRRGDAGYYLVAGGRPEFERALRFSPPFPARLLRALRGLGVSGYGGFVILLAGLFLAVPIGLLMQAGLGGWWLAVLAMVGFVPASDAAVACANRTAMWAVGARSLPGLELRDGVPASARTMVAVPTLLTSRKAVAEQVARLEVHHLSSPDGELHFALLSDWTDSLTEHADGDAALLAEAADGIARLNRLHGPAPGGDRFLLLHRHRVWNEGEARWIGWERKRGKLHELNRLLRGAADTTFLTSTAHSMPRDVVYVVTLDSDTRLPRDSVRRLIGKMMHPLNRPRFDAAAGRVLEGYSVLQPRVTPSLPVAEDTSLFQRIFSSMDGIDPYAAAASDVYQDLFGEGSYAGKGIYDIDAFEAALAGRVPDSTLLSHDLFEGVFARAGLASDIEVVEEFPTRYTVSAMRQHRWARGDWQLLPWLLPWTKGPGSRTATLPSIGRWKMLDNLRRTLSAPAAMLAFVAGWLLPFGMALGWTLFVLATIALPALLPVLGDLVPRRRWVTWRSYFEVLGAVIRHGATLTALNVVFLAHQASLMGDAILRTLVRVFMSRRNLLQWVTAAQANEGPQLGIAATARRMAAGPAAALVAVAVAVVAEPRVWLLVAPFAALWLASPAIAVWASACSGLPRRSQPSVSDIRALRMTARRTWRFFETFVTPADNMLPPDNFQEDPAPVVAHRTSPTNIGLYLLSTVSAHDFGWAGLVDTVERLEATLATMQRMARFKGHFYNWYDTADLRPLEPRYVSTVDSGNLAGHLIAVASACRTWRETSGTRAPEPDIDDAMHLAREELVRLAAFHAVAVQTAQSLDRALECDDVVQALELARTLPAEHGADLMFWLAAVDRAAASHQRDVTHAATLDERLSTLEQTARELALAMEFGFLRNEERKLLSIGFLVDEGVTDPNCYDLLASEARLAVFVAIAKDDVPAREWFRLGRAVTPAANGAALVSWSGSMFEYLMPSLVMRAPAGSLLEQTNRLVVQRQIDFGTARHVPWGVSESAYNVRDSEYTYQYSNFGIPGLGLKRGLDADLVVAPYATALAAMIDPVAAVHNFERLAREGGRGRFGFYEALDYTPSRIPDGVEQTAGVQPVAVVRAFMAHHQGMTIVATANAVLDGIMRSRFHAEPMMQATELLLQERAPRSMATARLLPAEQMRATEDRFAIPLGGRRFALAQGPVPDTHLLSNGRYSVMLTTAGSGYSRWANPGGDQAVTRWREDPTLDDWGTYIFLRDVRSGQIWSAGLQPSGVEPDEYEVAFREDRAEFARRDGTLSTTMDIQVSAEADADVRRLSISNAGPVAREIEITSYAEVALTSPAADLAHPAFAKMFVETEYVAADRAIIATRRRRTPDEPEIWAAHLIVTDGADTDGTIEVETDRARFLGRGRGVRDPEAIAGGPLSGSVGTVLDAVFSLRCRIRVAPGAMVRVAFWTMVASSRSELLGCIDKHRDITAFDRASTLAWTQAQVQMRHLGLTAGQADLFQRLAAHLLFAGPALRSPGQTILTGAGPQSGLWGQGISGDRPILLLRIEDESDVDLVAEVLLAHEYMRLKQLAVDLVILNDHAASYTQDLQIALEVLTRSRNRSDAHPHGARGSVTLLRADLVASETCALLASVARVVLHANRGGLWDQLDRLRSVTVPIAAERPKPSGAGTAVPPTPALELYNGLGGFADDGREYVVVQGPGHVTPAPWINVVANAGFGFQATAEGSGYTWAGNSRENQLTPWSNDPVTDRPGEAFFLADTATDELWYPTVSPKRDDAATYVTTHGRGFSRFDRVAFGIATSLVQTVPVDDPVKLSRLRLHNTSGRARSISVTVYVEWVLGPSRTATAPFVTTAIDAETGAMVASNEWVEVSASRVAFADLGGRQTSWTGDRREFIGRHGTVARPAALVRGRALSNTVGGGLDPCGALRTVVDLPPDGHAEILFLLGQAADEETARSLVRHYRQADFEAVLSAVCRQWDGILGAVAVRTPDRSMDIMLNGWLLYQALACRIWARAGFYQASGAYGFRDQLQDGMALAASAPELVRAHLVRAASRQFTEGDVQHWWLPESGSGVRTRISDDCAWLAFTVAHYVEATGDRAVLDEPVPFLAAPVLTPDEHDRFFVPGTSGETATLFEHCARALDHSLGVGVHGLPLMGAGDWNDGMNRVGEAGRGESVWLGWFLHAALTAFAPLADARHETARALAWRGHAAALVPALEQAWDGEWYLRAYFDDGTPLGSHADAECRIDAIAQSWAVLSGVAAPDRAGRAMASVSRELVRDGLALVLTPPFDRTDADPGYIKGYPPGIRENGGQYSHAAMWTVMAFAALGDGDEAARLFGMLNPINHARTPADVARYKTEPYAVAADIYATPPHVGRGGWTWYTGSAGWMQRAGIESILGLRIRAGHLHIDPCIPRDWPGYEATITWRATRIVIRVDNPSGVNRGIAAVFMDQVPASLPLPLPSDHAAHAVRVILGAS